MSALVIEILTSLTITYIFGIVASIPFRVSKQVLDVVKDS